MAAAALMSRRTLLALLACALAGSAQAGEIPPPAYQVAAQRAGIPSTVLYAVALQESGTRVG
ncbi:MAG: lytic transglycosylase domain-containing protein, partial [Variovorax sp.]